MDQTTFTNQIFFWNHGKCSKDPNLDRHFCIILISIIKKRLKLDITLYTFLQILSVSVFEKIPILQLVTNSEQKPVKERLCNQLNLFS